MAPGMSRKDLLQLIAECSKKPGESSAPALSGVKKGNGKAKVDNVTTGEKVTILVEDSVQSHSSPVTRKRKKKEVTTTGLPNPMVEDVEELTDRLLLSYVDVPNDVDSLWTSSSPPEQMIEKQLYKEADADYYSKLGPVLCSRAIELLGLRLVSLAKFTETEAASLTNLKLKLENDTIHLKKKIIENQGLIEDAESKVKLLSEVQKNLEKTQAELISCKSENAKLVATFSELTSSRDDLVMKLISADDKIKNFEVQINEFKMSAARYISEGFAAALEQFRCVYPDLDFTQFSVFKEVRDEQLVVMHVEGTAENAETKENTN